MVLVGCCVVPSWPGLLDLDLDDLPDCAEQLHISAKHLGDWVADQRPDLLLLVSHQGVGLSDIPALLTGSEATGTARFHDKWSDFSVTANLAEEVTVELADVLDKRRVDHCLLSMDGHAEGANKVRLGWGEVVPLWFLSETRGTSGTRKRVVPHEVVILCSPRPRGHSSDLPDLLDQCVSLGEEVGDILEQWQQRVVVVVPGDLCSDHRAGEQAFMQGLAERSGLKGEVLNRATPSSTSQMAALFTGRASSGLGLRRALA